MMKVRISLVILFVVVFSTVVLSQQLSFRSYTSAQGLSQNSGNCIVQDKLGYIWMGTQDGLNKFNGKEITTYYKEKVSRGKLANSFITSLYFDSSKNWLWIGTGHGLTIYNIYVDSFYNADQYFPSANGMKEMMIRSIVGINNVETAVSTFHDGLFICNSLSGSVRRYFNDISIKDSATEIVNWNGNIIAAAGGILYKLGTTPVPFLQATYFGDVRKMLVWQNEMWVSSSKKGLFRISSIGSPKASIFKCGSNEIGPLAIDNQNNLWIGTRNQGLVLIEPENKKIIHSYQSATNQDEWPQKFTLALFKDAQGTMWTGSSGGGFSACAKQPASFGLIRTREQLTGKAAHNMILSICNADEHSIFLGTQLEGMRKYDRRTGQIELLPNIESAEFNSIYGIVSSSPTDYWLATAGGMQYFNSITKKFTGYADKKYAVSLAGQSIYKLRNRDSLLYSSNRGTMLFDLKSRQFRPFSNTAKTMDNLVVYKTVEDDAGNLWMGCQEQGLVKYDIKTGAVKIIDSVGTFSKSVYGIYQDGRNFWLGTANGLMLYNIETGQVIKRLTINNGLPGSVIYSVEKDSQGDIWASTNSGLIKIDARTFTVLHINISAGLQSGEFNTACSLKDSSGYLYFGGINGVSFFNPAQLSLSAFSPDPVIESFRVYDKELQLKQNLAYTKLIELPHDQNFITLEYGVTNFTNNEGCTYRYQLVGADKEWINPGNRTYTNYANLKPGTYIFRLQSANSSGVWSKGITTLNIIISPAWWQALWLKLALVVIVAIIVMLMVRNRVNNVRRNAYTKQKITETEMAALKAQMNPHFMFNCINSIDAFIQSNDKYNATLYLNKFARLIRNVLDSSKQNIVIFSKDIDTLKLYVELEELRSENKFITKLNIDEELMNSDCKVPPLIIQPFVENAIIHGLRNKPGNNGLLEINIFKSDTQIIYSIVDNGIGRQASQVLNTGKEKSYGLQMSYDRIKLFNKEDVASVVFDDIYTDGIPAGTNVIVKLNMI